MGPYFKSFWDTVSPYFTLGWELFKTVFGWTPLGLIINNWGPVVKWFQDMWEKLKPIIEWFTDGASETVAAANAAQWGAGVMGLMVLALRALVITHTRLNRVDKLNRREPLLFSLRMPRLE